MIRSLLACVVAAALVVPAEAETLVLGDVAAFSPSRQAMVTTPDGATWVGWLSATCFGDLHVQRIDRSGALLMPGGLTFDLVDDCFPIRALLAPVPDGSVIVATTPHPFPLQRLDATGAPLWGAGVVLTEHAIGDVLVLPEGDVLVGWHSGWSLFVARLTLDGAAVWPQPAEITTITGSNKRFLALVPDDAGGVYLLWDEPGSSYVRRIWIARVSATGIAVWDEPLNVVPIDGPPSAAGSSRHTDPVAITDGDGGVVLVWTFGTESSSTPAPLLMQVVHPDGTLAFETQGRRIATQVSRQYEPVLARDATSGDIFVAWRDGGFDAQQLRAQRMTLGGIRSWGEQGVAVAPLGVGTSYFDASWNDGALTVLVGDDVEPGAASVTVRRVNAGGALQPDVLELSAISPAGPVRVVALGANTMISWQEQPDDGLVLAERICNGPCAPPGDVTGDGAVDVDDLVAVILAWGPCAECPADVTGDGVVDVDDLVAVIAGWR